MQWQEVPDVTEQEERADRQRYKIQQTQITAWILGAGMKGGKKENKQKEEKMEKRKEWREEGKEREKKGGREEGRGKSKELS